MRIEIYGGSGRAFASYQDKLDKLYDRIDDTIEALQDINHKISDVKGSLNDNLQSAQADINNRIRVEERKKTSVLQLQRNSAEFFDNAISTDKKVSEAIIRNEKKFYEKHPHLAPKEIDKGSVLNWLLEKWEGFCDTAEQIWNGIVEFVKEHAVQLIVGAVALAVGAVITYLSGGALAPLVIGVLKGMLVSGLFSATISAFTGGDILDGFLDGLAEGFMWGGIFVLAASIVSVVKNIIKSGSQLNGIRIINKKYAGKTYMLEGELATKYPKGVKFTKEGFPDFKPYKIKKVTVRNLEGDAYFDFIKANKKAKYISTPKCYTWHHVEDGKTMLLIPSDLHNAVKHTGGASLIRKGIRP